ncbi:Wzz/FepE/Etk N-terminal domain-containing protein [Aestuariivita sp.]|jgi:uncharacterized protein involved in exopolysaccharide biosynthesis|uniref:GumC family protein n=1 Tax=Aestuariivita sp. TaxID=1872407 RepID=UPI00216E0E5F|nr:Wzz/FepE/Etk N-terminal domain-containing protein [Aestuariivita sp.]MCE8009681.1 DUF874 domain-containing protein [Aestuariivita sp.]
MGPIYSLEDVIDMVRRRIMIIFAVTVLGALAGVFFALSQPHAYETAEVIQIERAKIADDLAPSTVEGSSARRLQAVQQQLTTRGVMLEIIDKHQIFADLPGLSAMEKAQMLREAISIDGVAAAREGFADDGEISALTISVRLATAEQAHIVARELSARTIELYATRRIDEARTTLQFFTEQQDQIIALVQALEDEITGYRASHELSVAGSLEFQRSQMAALSSAILDIEREQISAQRALDQVNRDGQRQATRERELTALRTQLDSLDAQRRLLQSRLERLSASIETSPEVERQLGAYDREMDQLREQLSVINTRRAEAEVGLRLETERKAERLTVLEPAALPLYPVTPSRKRTVILATAGSALLGFVIAFVMELRNPVIRTAQQMEREVGIAPVITLPNVTVHRRKPGRLTRLIAWFNGQVPVETTTDKPRKLQRHS